MLCPSWIPTLSQKADPCFWEHHNSHVLLSPATYECSSPNLRRRPYVQMTLDNFFSNLSHSLYVQIFFFKELINTWNNDPYGVWKDESCDEQENVQLVLWWRRRVGELSHGPGLDPSTWGWCRWEASRGDTCLWLRWRPLRVWHLYDRRMGWWPIWSQAGLQGGCVSEKTNKQTKKRTLQNIERFCIH